MNDFLLIILFRKLLPALGIISVILFLFFVTGSSFFPDVIVPAIIAVLSVCVYIYYKERRVYKENSKYIKK
jgi:4-amino-4-deoxy-L-arabinose transferase-like glycosyltransferase